MTYQGLDFTDLIEDIPKEEGNIDKDGDQDSDYNESILIEV